MYGFVRPLKCEMKVRDFELFQSEYCGLCHALKQSYGFFSSFLVSYDLTFFSLLLAVASDMPTSFENRRCVASPFKKKCVCVRSRALESSAGLCVILAYWKLRDDAHDEGFWGSVPKRAALLLFRRAYLKAKRVSPGFDGEVRRSLGELSVLEKNGCESVDAPADAFGRILAYGAELVEDEKASRAAMEILYHVGRWIYIMDAVLDLKEDIKSGSYNALKRRFSVESGGLSDEDKEGIGLAAGCSVRAAQLAYELLPKMQASDVLENILYLGLPSVQKSVLNEKWAGRKYV